MKKSSLDLQQILKAGGNVIVDANDYSALELQNIAAKAMAGESCVTIKNADRLSDLECQYIAKKAPKLVTFDFTK
ncbi:MAG: hypothetical protein SNJ29_14990 [Rikenellaceae bacterium]